MLCALEDVSAALARASLHPQVPPQLLGSLSHVDQPQSPLFVRFVLLRLVKPDAIISDSQADYGFQFLQGDVYVSGLSVFGNVCKCLLNNTEQASLDFGSQAGGKVRSLANYLQPSASGT